MAQKSKLIFEYEKKFYEIYQRSVLPLLMQYEIERRAIMLRLIFLEIILILVLCFLSYDLIINRPYSNFTLYIKLAELIIIPVLIYIICALPLNHNHKFVNKIKSSTITKILPAFGDMQWYDKGNLISENELQASELFGKFDHRDFYDGFHCNYKGVNADISETALIQASGKNSVNVFKGVVIRFNANKQIKNTTIVSSKGDMHVLNGFYMSWWLILLYIIFIIYGLMSIRNDFNFEHVDINTIKACTGIVGIIITIIVCSFKKLKLEFNNSVKLEDPEFSKRYNVYSSDQVEARYLVTTAFMERFNNLQTAFGTNKVKCSFYNDSIMFAISTEKNLFEVGNLFCSLSNPKQMRTFFNELASILALVDYFKLNEETRL